MDEQRLIDANALIDWLTKATGFRTNCDDCTDIDCLDCIIEEAIKNAPTVEAKPVVHAHWTGSNRTYCSHCERSYMDVADADSWESSDIPDFCPYCGAKMDEKENDNATY